MHNNKNVLDISHKRELEWNAQQMSSPNKERAIFSRVKLRPSIDLPFRRIFTPFKTFQDSGEIFWRSCHFEGIFKIFHRVWTWSKTDTPCSPAFPWEKSFTSVSSGWTTTTTSTIGICLFFLSLFFVQSHLHRAQIKIVLISRIIRKSHLHPAQMACPSTHCQILISGFISLNYSVFDFSILGELVAFPNCNNNQLNLITNGFKSRWSTCPPQNRSGTQTLFSTWRRCHKREIITNLLHTLTVIKLTN